MARSFNGTSDVINLGSDSALASLSSFTVGAWLKRNGGTSFRVLFSSRGAVTNVGWAAGLGNTSNNYYLVKYGVVVDDSGIASTNATWEHVVWTVDSGSTARLYVNGVLKYTAADSSAISSGAANAEIGAENNVSGSGSVSFFPGSIADAFLAASVLSVGQIAALSAGVRPFQIGVALSGYWPLDGLSSPEPDLSGNAHNGTLTGTSAAAGPPIALFTPRMPAFLAAAAAGFTAVNRRTLGPRVGSRSVY